MYFLLKKKNRITRLVTQESVINRERYNLGVRWYIRSQRTLSIIPEMHIFTDEIRISSDQELPDSQPRGLDNAD